MNIDQNYDDGGEGQLPEALKSFAAELSALAPCSDRLERERLLFLAGQASVDIDNRMPGQSFFRRQGWAAAFAGMTAVAATLLVVLLSVPRELVSSQEEFARLPSGFERDVERLRFDDATPQGISTATIFREDGLEKILADTSSGMTEGDSTKIESAKELQQSVPLTPAAWEQLFDET